MRESPMMTRVVVCVVAMVGLCGCHKETKVAVECRSAGATLSAGMACTLDHRQGDSAAQVCWDVNVSCQNGTRGKAHGCGSVDPQAKSSVVMPFTAFGGSLEKCDAVAGASVDGLVLTASP